MRNEKGFTLIELVVVIVILGILAAVAVPKFVNMQVDARISAVSGLYGAVQSASSLAHSQGLVEGDSQTSVDDSDTVTMEGTTVNLYNGYPSAAATSGIGDAVNIDGFVYTTTGANGTATFTLGTNTNCTVTYQVATAGGVPTITNNASAANCP